MKNKISSNLPNILNRKLDNNFTSISILIVSKNNSKTIESAIYSALNQNLPKNIRYEVLVFDDNSDYEQKEILKNLKNKKISNLKIYFSEKSVGLGKGRNFLIDKSDGEILFFLDGDAEASSDWVKKTVPLFKEKGVGIVTSLVVFKKRPDLVNGLGGSVNYSFFGVDKYFCEYLYFVPKTPFYTLYGMGNGLVVKKEVFSVIGKFKEDELSYEDVDLCFRSWVNGFKVVANPYGMVYHDTISIINHSLIRKYYDVLGRLKIFLIYSPLKFFPKFLKEELIMFTKYDIGFKIIYLKAMMSLIKNFFLILSSRLTLRNRNNRYFILKKLDPFFGSYKIRLIDFRKDLYNLSKNLDLNNPFYSYEKLNSNHQLLILNKSAKFRLIKETFDKALIVSIEKLNLKNQNIILEILINIEKHKYYYFFKDQNEIKIKIPKDCADYAGYVDLYFNSSDILLIKKIYFL